jgi:hypothetical protein
VSEWVGEKERKRHSKKNRKCELDNVAKTLEQLVVKQQEVWDVAEQQLFLLLWQDLANTNTD